MGQEPSDRNAVGCRKKELVASQFRLGHSLALLELKVWFHRLKEIPRVSLQDRMMVVWSMCLELNKLLMLVVTKVGGLLVLLLLDGHGEGELGSV